MNLPNAITVARVLLVPVFLVLAYGGTRSSHAAAFAVFLVASLSDSLDGYLARRWDIVTSTGQYLDPLADKLLVGAALVVLVTERRFPWWAAAIIVVREIAVSVLRTRIVSTGGKLPASGAGKVKTVLQVAMVGWWLLFAVEGPFAPGHWILMAAVLAVTIWSGMAYFIGFTKGSTST